MNQSNESQHQFPKRSIGFQHYLFLEKPFLLKQATWSLQHEISLHNQLRLQAPRQMRRIIPCRRFNVMGDQRAANPPSPPQPPPHPPSAVLWLPAQIPLTPRSHLSHGLSYSATPLQRQWDTFSLCPQFCCNCVVRRRKMAVRLKKKKKRKYFTKNLQQEVGQ